MGSDERVYRTLVVQGSEVLALLNGTTNELHSGKILQDQNSFVLFLFVCAVVYVVHLFFLFFFLGGVICSM